MFRFHLLFLLLSFAIFMPTHALDADWVYRQVDCPVRMPYTYDAVCGLLTVPENRSLSTTATIDLTIMHIASDNSAASDADPVVYITGGPGSPLLRNAASIASYEPMRNLLEERDLILMDTRGTGTSRPTLICDEGLDLAAMYAVADDNPVYHEVLLDGLQACYDELVAQGIDLSAYRTQETAADFEALRQALGIPQWNLVGASYGSKIALTIARDYPDSVRSLVLDAAYPLDVNILRDYMQNAEDAFAELFAACAAQTRCDNSYAELGNTFYTLYNELNDTPVTLRVQTYEDDVVPVVFTGTRMYQWAFSWLYQPRLIRELPRYIQQMAQGDYRPFVERNVRGISARTNGLYWAVQCNEEYAFADSADIDLIRSTHANLSAMIDNATMMGMVGDICGIWGSATPNPIDDLPVISDVPALLLTGQFDPITPIAWAEQGASHLPNSFVYRLPSVGHSTFFWNECAANMVGQFVLDPATEPDTSCIDEIETLQFARPQRTS